MIRDLGKVELSEDQQKNRRQRQELVKRELGLRPDILTTPAESEHIVFKCGMEAQMKTPMMKQLTMKAFVPDEEAYYRKVLFAPTCRNAYLISRGRVDLEKKALTENEIRLLTDLDPYDEMCQRVEDVWIVLSPEMPKDGLAARKIRSVLKLNYELLRARWRCGDPWPEDQDEQEVIRVDVDADGVSQLMEAVAEDAMEQHVPAEEIALVSVGIARILQNVPDPEQWLAEPDEPLIEAANEQPTSEPQQQEMSNPEDPPMMYPEDPALGALFDELSHSLESVDLRS